MSSIHIKKSKVGSLHKHLGVDKNKKIPRSKLSIKSTDSPSIRKKKQFAINARKWHHAEGGFIERDEFGFGGILQAIAPFANLIPIPGLGTVISGVLGAAGGLMEKGSVERDQLDEQNRLKTIDRQKLGQMGIANNYMPTFQDGGQIPTNLFRTNKTAYVDSVLNANPDIEWVQRLRNRNAPSMRVPGYAAPSSHLMSHNSQGYVFPRIVDRGKGLEYMDSDDKAMNYALNTDNGIQFPPEQGGWFAANGYKKGTGVLQREYGEGGFMPEPNQTPVELEKQETFQTPEGQMGQVNAPSHAQGGIDMSLPAGSFVWSDKLKSSNGRTFAEEAGRLGKMRAKYEKILNS